MFEYLPFPGKYHDDVQREAVLFLRRSPYDEGIFKQLLDGEIDEHLAKHIAHMFIRDPLQVFRERIEQDDTKSSEHFETIQSSNWMNMRFKVQLTDFENAAYCCFVVLLTRVILSYRSTYLLPISMVNENMKRAQKRDAVLEQKFFFRKGVATCRHPPDEAGGGDSAACTVGNAKSEDIEEMTINEIVNGREKEWPGLVPMLKQFLDSADVDVDTRCTISQYLNFISQRASGQIPTLANWTREFVQNHTAYKKDSRVPDETIYDLLSLMSDISSGQKHCPRLLGSFRSKTDQLIPSAAPDFLMGQKVGKQLNYTHKGMFEYLPFPGKYHDDVQREAVLFLRRSPVSKTAMKWLLLCALTKECIAPPGSTVVCMKKGVSGCHR
ncbi:unnamed protein product, partial [Mesorhabditis spiculigera]